MPVQTGPQPLLVKEMGNQTDAAAEHEQTVEDTHFQVVLSLFGSEGTSAADKVHEADSNATINVEDEVVLLGSCDRLDGQSVIEELGAREVLLDVLLDELDTEIGVVTRLDPVADTGNCRLLDIDKSSEW